MQPFGPILKRLRESRGLTQQELAARLKRTAQRVSNLECNRREDPRWSTIQALADALGVPLEELRTEKPKRQG